MAGMDGSMMPNFRRDFGKYKKESGIPSDPGGLLEGLWSEEQDRAEANFEKEYPGINKEFDELISMLPDPNSVDKDEFPFAAAVVRVTQEGKLEVLARQMNRVKKDSDSTQHAEMAVLREAQQVAGDRHLEGAILLSTAQPCDMCAGAARNTKIGSVVYGVSQDELRGKHVKFRDGYKPIRTAPEGIDIDGDMQKAKIRVFAGYKHDEVLAKLTRFVGTFNEYYSDPDA